jgi:hypothetical protein
MINVDFEFFNAKEEDYRSVYVLVQQQLAGDLMMATKAASASASTSTSAMDVATADGSSSSSGTMAINLSEIADYVVAKQQRIGSVIKVEGQDDAFGFISVINAQQYKVLPRIPHSTTSH